MRRRLAEGSRLLNADGAQHNTALHPTGMMKFLGQDNMPQARGKDPVCLLIQRCLQTEEPREEALLLAGFLSLLLAGTVGTLPPPEVDAIEGTVGTGAGLELFSVCGADAPVPEAAGLGACFGCCWAPAASGFCAPG